MRNSNQTERRSRKRKLFVPVKLNFFSILFFIFILYFIMLANLFFNLWTSLVSFWTCGFSQNFDSISTHLNVAEMATRRIWGVSIPKTTYWRLALECQVAETRWCRQMIATTSDPLRCHLRNNSMCAERLIDVYLQYRMKLGAAVNLIWSENIQNCQTSKAPSQKNQITPCIFIYSFNNNLYHTLFP